MMRIWEGMKKKSRMEASILRLERIGFNLKETMERTPTLISLNELIKSMNLSKNFYLYVLKKVKESIWSKR